ncbi:hypothetical protein [Burkholderia ubonensis]|uniref:hypothetical protein n=1 Tax=Burkholderia ubonensis TaxID=101571 RepID=UPI00075E3AF5|nr:hypothetical protein [Burkholderia ubonensis]KVD23677.1 hypothetical protein WI83_31370 [Burkholderia ubonensis]
MAKKIGICRMCSETHQFVKSHVIPEAFYGGLGHCAANENDDSQTVRMFSPSGRATNVRIGIYGQFLCKACEELFQDIDDYAITLFRDQMHPADPEKDHVFVGRDIVDTEAVRLFILATTWRASVCEHSFFSGVSLGARESVYRNLLWDSLKERCSTPEEISAVGILLYVVKFPDHRVLLPPSRFDIPGTGQAFIRLYFGDFVVFVLIDGPSLTTLQAEAALPDSEKTASGPLKIFRRALDEAEFFAVLDLANARNQYIQR